MYPYFSILIGYGKKSHQKFKFINLKKFYLSLLHFGEMLLSHLFHLLVTFQKVCAGNLRLANFIAHAVYWGHMLSINI